MRRVIAIIKEEYFQCSRCALKEIAIYQVREDETTTKRRRNDDYYENFQSLSPTISLHEAKRPLRAGGKKGKNSPFVKDGHTKSPNLSPHC